MKTSIQSLQSDGCVSFIYPADLRKSVEETVELWKEFCGLPKEAKELIPYSNASAGIGYELKEGGGYKADHKENFDATLATQAWLSEQNGVEINPVIKTFVTSAAALVNKIKPLVLDFTHKAEKEYNLIGLVDEVEKGEDAFFIRFIHYFGKRKTGDEICMPHVDQSGFTPHLYESAAGLQRLTYEGKWVDMPVSSGETVIIPAMQMQLRSNGTLKALCHRVVATSESAEVGRYSAVCFVRLKNTPYYNKQKHGRLQEREPGFNYQLNPQEFASLFKK